MVLVVRGREHLRFIDVVDANCLENLRGHKHDGVDGMNMGAEEDMTNLCLDKMSYPHFRHNRDRNGIDDLFDHFWVALGGTNERRLV